MALCNKMAKITTLQ